MNDTENDLALTSSLSVKTTPEIDSLIVKIKEIQKRQSGNQKIIEKKTNFIFCPICQDGYLYPTERGKAFKVFSDVWLVCEKCGSEFDKKLGKATLLKATVDPYGNYAKFKSKTFTLKEWADIALKRLKEENFELGEQINSIEDKLADFFIDGFINGRWNLCVIDLNSFILKKNEIALFGTKAHIIEEKKRKVTQRTTTGGRRNYGGFSFRVAKGVYYHTGSSTAAAPRQTTIQSTEYTELIPVDYGDFVITNQRIMFKGNRSRGLAIPINKIAAIDVDPGEDALLVIQENKKPVILKLLISFKAYISDIEVPLSVKLDDLVGVIKRSS